MATGAVNAVGQIESGGIASIAPWLSRLVTIPPALIMILIGVRFITDPVHGVAGTGVSLSTPEAVTDTRVIGALALTIAGVLASMLVSRRRLRAAHALVVGLMALILAIRMFGFSVDGTTLAMGGQKVKFTVEVVFLVLNTLAFSLQSYVSKRIGGRR
jgi:hypothetical protein